MCGDSTRIPGGASSACLDARESDWIEDPAAGLPGACTSVDLPRFADVP